MQHALRLRKCNSYDFFSNKQHCNNISFQIFDTKKPIFKLNISQSIVHEAMKSPVSSIKVKVCPRGFEDALLVKINQLRALHQAPPVNISDSDPWETEGDFYSAPFPMGYYTHWEKYVTNQT